LCECFTRAQAISSCLAGCPFDEATEALHKCCNIVLGTHAVFILPGWFSATARAFYVHAKHVGRKIFPFCRFTSHAMAGTTATAYAKSFLAHISVTAGGGTFLSAASDALYLAWTNFRKDFGIGDCCGQECPRSGLGMYMCSAICSATAAVLPAVGLRACGPKWRFRPDRGSGGHFAMARQTI
jgi:hypothetical protein